MPPVTGTRVLFPVPCVSDSCQKARPRMLTVLEPNKLSASPGLGGSIPHAAQCGPKKKHAGLVSTWKTHVYMEALPSILYPGVQFKPLRKPLSSQVRPS